MLRVTQAHGLGGPVCYVFCGTQTFFRLTEPESVHAEPGKENLRLFLLRTKLAHNLKLLRSKDQRN